MYNNNRKGQAAMEFLMTYGWAILAAIVVIAVLAIYFRPSSIVSSSTIVSAPFFANGQTINSSTVQLEVKNNGGETYNITEFDVTVRSPTGVTCTGANPGSSIQAGELIVLEVDCTGATSGDTLNGDISIGYTKTGSALTLRSTGTIAGTVASS